MWALAHLGIWRNKMSDKVWKEVVKQFNLVRPFAPVRQKPGMSNRAWMTGSKRETDFIKQTKKRGDFGQNKNRMEGGRRMWFASGNHGSRRLVADPAVVSAGRHQLPQKKRQPPSYKVLRTWNTDGDIFLPSIERYSIFWNSLQTQSCYEKSINNVTKRTDNGFVLCTGSYKCCISEGTLLNRHFSWWVFFFMKTLYNTVFLQSNEPKWTFFFRVCSTVFGQKSS